MFTGPACRTHNTLERRCWRDDWRRDSPSDLTHGIETGERCSPRHRCTPQKKVGLRPYQELRGAIVELLCIHNMGHVRGIAPEGGFVNVCQRHDHGVIMAGHGQQQFPGKMARERISRVTFSVPWGRLAMKRSPWAL